MNKTISNVNGEIILSYQENGYQKIIEQFNDSSYINIVTFNINTFEPTTELIKELRKVKSSIPITLILNIPGRREDYINKRTRLIDEVAVENAKKKIKYTLNVLERSKFGDLNIYFNFDNHSKLIMTDAIAYIGSQNFSDASKENFELGVLIDDPKKVSRINKEIFMEIKKHSIRYATSEYAIVMEEIARIMRDLLQDIRQTIFIWMGDEPYIKEIEIIDIDNIYFPEQKWEEFKELHYKFEEIIDNLVNDYPSEFNKGEAEKKVEFLRDLITNFSSELDGLAHFINSTEEYMLWDKFHQIDTGDNIEAALAVASDYVREYKLNKFQDIESIGKELIESFDAIENCIYDIEKVINEIKEAMINRSIYQNIKKIQNY